MPIPRPFTFACRSLAPSIAILVASGIIGWTSGSLVASENVDFNRDIRPILSEMCWTCHGPDEATREAGLRLDVPEAALADLGGYAAVVPGDADASAVIERVSSSDDSMRMPPEGSGRALTEAEIERLRQWIDQGARYDAHWAYVPPRRPPLPEVADERWVRNPIDRFILARLESEGMTPSPEADRATLARRVALALTGLPPTPEEVAALEADSRPDAYERFVDALLARPAFGERWARVWLDLARYADSAGYADDPERTIWAYRDYVIRSFNANKPFDQFTIEQIAGDLLDAPTDEQLVATAFHRNTMTNNEGGTNDEQFRNEAIVDRVNTTMSVWMGTTMACAQCHTHKYDPLTQEEYFRLFAIFNQTQDADRRDESPVIELAIGTTVPVMREVPSDQRRETRIQLRGSYQSLGDVVQPGVPAVFHPLRPRGSEGDLADADGEGHPADRLALAHWLVAPENPLTARVVANRFWEQIFGIGIVETSEDFGSQGDLPSHPHLLDYLALELVDNGWDMKALLKEMVTSATYRQSSRVTSDLLAADFDNRLYARGPRFRISAETVRDQALAASGLLSHKMYGPPVHPPQPQLGLTAAFGSATDWKTSEGEDRYRRGVYTLWRRSNPYPSMATFDAPNREVCTLRRSRTNTPLQALVTMNDPVYVEAAQALARRMMACETVEDQIRSGFQWCVLRDPDAEEVAHLVHLYQRAEASLRSDPEQARRLAEDPLGPLDSEVDPGAAAMTVVAGVLMNLDEMFMPR